MILSTRERDLIPLTHTMDHCRVFHKFWVMCQAADKSLAVYMSDDDPDVGRN